MTKIWTIVANVAAVVGLTAASMATLQGCVVSPTSNGDQDPDPSPLDAGREADAGQDGGSRGTEPEPQEPAPLPEPDPLEPVPAPPADCGDADPLTNASWVGFCEDRVDDNCTNEQRVANCTDLPTVHNFCQTGDEECPTTRPASGPPAFDCLSAPPANVVAFARLDVPNPQVAAMCIYVYESDAFAGEHYVAVDVTDGTDPAGPAAQCADDYSARRYLYFSDLIGADDSATDCEPVRYTHAYPEENTTTNTFFPVDEQKLSNGCRKAIRNIVRNVQSNFDPDIQYFAASRDEALAKIAILETAEVACLGIDQLDGTPYRVNEVWISQATAPLVLTGQ